jgi:hypothetical protein
VYVDEKYGFVRGEDSAGSEVNVRDGARFVKVLRAKVLESSLWRGCGAVGRTLGRLSNQPFFASSL